MIEVKLTQNPLLQLNIMLWMTRPGREEWINPYFYNNGFELLVIEPEVTLPPRVTNFLNKNDFNFLNNPRPELILVNRNKKAFIIIECKNQGFDITDESSRETRQTVSFLCYNGKIICDNFGLEGNEYEAILKYNIVQDNYIEEFSAALNDLRNKIINCGLEKSNLPAVSYFKEEDDFVYLIFFVSGNDILREIDFKDKIKIMPSESGAISPPFYLIPMDSSGRTDRYGHFVFYKRIKNRLGSFLGQNLWKRSDNILDLEKDVLEEIIPVWDLWNNPEAKRYVRREANNYIKDILNTLVQEVEDFDYERITDGYKFIDIDRELRREVLQEFKKVKIKRESAEIIKQQTRFDFE